MSKLYPNIYQAEESGLWISAMKKSWIAKSDRSQTFEIIMAINSSSHLAFDTPRTFRCEDS
ncbi:MAG: hypothetical protein KME22_25680 [Hassallia sp. WJT32-NPBG1]|nr:hypothetical protein [Hassallia sp. WJT32-NPBG1]